MTLFVFIFLHCSVDDVDGIDMLRWEDQQRIRKYVEDGGSSHGGDGSSTAAKAVATEFSVEVSQNARASCKKCGEKITKGEVSLLYLLVCSVNCILFSLCLTII